MHHFQRIYRDHADRYDALVAAEDVDGVLLPALQAVAPLAGARVVEAGAGTGRLTRLLAAAGAAHLTATEPAAAMRDVAARHLAAEAPPGCAWQVVPGDVRDLPAPDAAADLSLAGWVLGHFTEFNPAGWEADLDQALAELRRVVRPGGHAVVIETLGTGAAEPAAPTPALAALHARMEAAGFRRVVLRTDYLFASVDEAVAICGFFFGPELAAALQARGERRVPEWTGLWHREA
ncbi:MAG: class I SAM-dependent methyltransferase [Myxococcales bacterium]|nr:class I SAM-dependent methyltransferase [Myxococcales bacterium]